MAEIAELTRYGVPLTFSILLSDRNLNSVVVQNGRPFETRISAHAQPEVTIRIEFYRYGRLRIEALEFVHLLIGAVSDFVGLCASFQVHRFGRRTAKKTRTDRPVGVKLALPTKKS